MTDLYNVIGNKTYANLLADPQGADAIGVPIAPGAGELKAGWLLCRDTDTGIWAQATTDDTGNYESIDCAVLAEDVDATADDAAVDAKAYRAGIFVDGKVTIAGTALTAAQKIALRKQGIVFDKPESTATFDNIPS